MVRVIIGCTIRNLSVLNQAKLKLCTCSKCDSSLVPYATYRDHQNKAKRDRSRAAYNSIHTPPDLLPESNVSNPMGENDTHNPPRALPQTDDGDNDVINIPPDDLEVSGDEMDRITISQRYDSIQNLADDNWDTLIDEDTVDSYPPAINTSVSIPPLEPIRNTTGIPLCFTKLSPEEGTSDPFQQTKAWKDTAPLEDVHEVAFIRILYLLVTWLHSQFHVPFRAIAAILGVVNYILISAGAITPTTWTPATFHTVLHHMGLEPDFDVLPCCPTCLEVYPASLSTPDKCIVCKTDLYVDTKTRKGKQRKQRIPRLQFPYLSISQQLPMLLSVPGMESMLDSWRKRPRTAGSYSDMFDGQVARDILGIDGSPFFRNLAVDENGPNGELRIGVAMGVDWQGMICMR